MPGDEPLRTLYQWWGVITVPFGLARHALCPRTFPVEAKVVGLRGGFSLCLWFGEGPCARSWLLPRKWRCRKGFGCTRRADDNEISPSQFRIEWPLGLKACAQVALGARRKRSGCRRRRRRVARILG